MKTIFYVNSKWTGGHYAFKTDKSNKPFENPMHYYAKLTLKKDDVVSDIGGYIGEYSLYAAIQGVKSVFVYEPTPESFNLLTKNCGKHKNIHTINKAVVGDNVKSINLYISSGIGVTNSIAKRKSKFIKVNAINYTDAVKNSTVVKIDVEGAEYSYPIIQKNLRAIIIEFHPVTHIDWKTEAVSIMDKIESSGYKCILRPGFKSGWDLTGCWEKK